MNSFSETLEQPLSLFNESQTKVNLLRAFAGESQARNRYTFAAEIAKKAGLHVIEQVFLFTADQERAHGKVYYDFLAKAGSEEISLDASCPIDGGNDVLSLLRASQNNEYNEFEDIYPQFGSIAKEEGFPNIARHFFEIASIEKTHGNRFGQFADLMEENKLFVSEVQVGWMCLNCGNIVLANQAPRICPVCDHPQGFFIRATMAPYTGTL